MLRLSALGMVIMLSVAGSSCRTLNVALREPVVSLHSVDVTDVSMTGVELLCKVDVENPNSLDIPFPEIDWELFINTNSFISGIVENKKSIKARSVTVVDVPVRLSYVELLNTVKSLKGRQEADYQIVLGARFLLPVLGERIWSFEYGGKFPLAQMVAFRNPSFKIEGLDFAGADILCSVDIYNPNVFPIPFPDMSYIYAVRGNNFVTSTVVHPGPLASGALTPVLIRLRVVYSDLYRNFAALRSIGEASCLFSLNSRLSLPGHENETFAMDIPGNLPLLKPPVLSFRGISVKNIGLSKIDFEFGWDVDNPNGFNLSLKDLGYELTVNNSRWAEGKVQGNPELTAGRKIAIPLTVSVNSSSMVKDLTDIITRGMEVTYDLTGTVAFSADVPGFSAPGAPFSFTGRTRLRR